MASIGMALVPIVVIVYISMRHPRRFSSRNIRLIFFSMAVSIFSIVYLESLSYTIFFHTLISLQQQQNVCMFIEFMLN